MREFAIDVRSEPRASQLEEGVDSGRTLFRVFQRVAGDLFAEIRRWK